MCWATARCAAPSRRPVWMRTVWHLAINSLAGRRGRTTLLVLAVALAAALTVAVGSALSTAEHSMERQVAEVMGLTDLIVANKYSGALPAGLTATLRAMPGVQIAAGRYDAGIFLRNDRTGEKEAPW